MAADAILIHRRHLLQLMFHVLSILPSQLSETEDKKKLKHRLICVPEKNYSPASIQKVVLEEVPEEETRRQLLKHVLS